MSCLKEFLIILLSATVIPFCKILARIRSEPDVSKEQNKLAL